MDRYEFKVSRYGENLENLEWIHAIMAKHNPDCKLMVTISPVNLWATFRKDRDVISASCNSKSTLRAVADAFVASHDNVFYFPAFEMATIYRPMLKAPAYQEGRENFHVNRETVKFIMRQFFRMFSDGQERI